MKKISKTVNFFTYDYPSKGNDSPFIKDEIIYLSKIFKRVNIIPIKKKNFTLKSYRHYKNIYTDYGLSKLFFSKSIIIIFFKSLFKASLWNEINKAGQTFFLKKIYMIIKENFYSEIVCSYIKKNSYDLKNDIFFSFWSNFILISFNKLKIKNSFSRTLGSDLNGFLLNDPFVAFEKKKFKELKFILILNEGHKKKLISRNLISRKKIIKSYLGMNTQNFFNKTNKNKRKIFFLSCGSLIDVKDPLSIIELVTNFAKQNKQIEVNYTCIGNGHLQEKVKDKLNEESNLINYKYIERIPNLFTYLKKNQVDYFINLSHSEGIAFTNMEVMSCGIPVVCNNIPGNIELINNRNGIVFNKINDTNYSLINNLIFNNHIDEQAKQRKRKEAFLTIKSKFNRKLAYKKFSKIIYDNFS